MSNLKRLLILLFLATLLLLGLSWLSKPKISNFANLEEFEKQTQTDLHPLAISNLRQDTYPGSPIKIEEELPAANNYKRYLASYLSENLKIYAYLTIPNNKPPKKGYPAIIFNHGYIPPQEYRSTERYLAYMDGFSSNGYVLFRPDYRGHGFSEGEPGGAYGSNDYTIDVLNAFASVKKMQQVNPKKIGMWGHSLGGHLTLRAMVTNKNIKAGVIWAGVVASYPDLINNWRHSDFRPTLTPGRVSWRQQLSDLYGEPDNKNEFWQSISATSFLADISGPLQLHHGTADISVPVAFSQTLQQLIEQANRVSELYIYEDDDHNLSQNFSLAMDRSLAFFDQYLKAN